MLLSFVRGCLKKRSGVEGAKSILRLPNARGRSGQKSQGKIQHPPFIARRLGLAEAALLL